MPLPTVGPTPDSRQVSERLGVLIRDYNRTDYAIPLYAADTGSATAYVIAPIPGIETYSVGQIFTFKAANANSGTAPTLAVNGLTAGTIYLSTGGALTAGDIAANGMTMVQVASTTPTFHLLNPLVSPVPTNTNRMLQMVSTVTGAVATGTTLIPADDTIPQNTEGDQYMSLAITPQSSTSKLIIDVTVNGAASGAAPNAIFAALFQDTTANALAVAWTTSYQAGTAIQVKFSYTMTSGTTSATTFKVRVGAQNAGTFTFNGVGGARFMGGVLASSIVIREVLP